MDWDLKGHDQHNHEYGEVFMRKKSSSSTSQQWEQPLEHHYLINKQTTIALTWDGHHLKTYHLSGDYSTRKQQEWIVEGKYPIFRIFEIMRIYGFYLHYDDHSDKVYLSFNGNQYWQVEHKQQNTRVAGLKISNLN